MRIAQRRRGQQRKVGRQRRHHRNGRRTRRRFQRRLAAAAAAAAAAAVQLQRRHRLHVAPSALSTPRRFRRLKKTHTNEINIHFRKLKKTTWKWRGGGSKLKFLFLFLDSFERFFYLGTCKNEPHFLRTQFRWALECSSTCSFIVPYWICCDLPRILWRAAAPWRRRRPSGWRRLWIRWRAARRRPKRRLRRRRPTSGWSTPRSNESNASEADRFQSHKQLDLIVVFQL